MSIALLDISISRPKPKKGREAFRPRTFEDGSIEVELPNGRRIRQKPSICQGCGSPKIDNFTGKIADIMAVHAGLCMRCYELELVARDQALAQERIARLATGKSPARRRYFAIVLATPLWRDRLKIKEIYDEAARLTAETGEQFEVDHIYPIQSQYACGLHVHQNLQIIERTHNRSKGNSFPMFDSPALR